MTDDAQPQPVVTPVVVATADKCDDMAHETPLRLGGAHNFNDAEAYRQGQLVDTAVYDLWSTFDDIRYNIQHDPELTGQQQAAQITDASQQLAARLVAVPGEVAAGKETVIDKLKQGYRKVVDVLNPQPPAPDDPDGATSFIVTKDLAQNYRWLALASNNFKDRDGEWFSEEAHLDYVNYVDETADYPELRLWHVKGSRIGMADFVAYADHFMLVSGTFDKEFEYLAPIMAAKQYGVSHGFRYREVDKQANTYTRYRSFEVSALPPDKAANPWTAFGSMESIKEVAMLPDVKKQFVIDHLGADKTALLEAKLTAMGKELEGLGISFKELDTAAPAAPAQTAAPAAAPAPAAALDVAAPAAAVPAAAPVNAPAAAVPVAQADPTTPPPAPVPDPGDPPPGEPTGDGGDTPAEGSAELTEAIKALVGLPAQLTAITDRLTALEGGKAADATPAMAATVAQTRPSQSDGNTVPSDKAKALETLIGDDKGGETTPKSPVNKFLTQVFGEGVAAN